MSMNEYRSYCEMGVYPCECPDCLEWRREIYRRKKEEIEEILAEQYQAELDNR